MKKEIVVIGSGPGGSACAALLASRGNRVTVLEQNRFIGGKCSTSEENGFAVDSGVHMFARGPGGPHGTVARELGVPQPWCVSDPVESVRLNEKGVFYLYQNPLSFAGVREFAVTRLTGRQKIGILNSLHHSIKQFGVTGLLKELGRAATSLPSFIYEYDDVTVLDFINQFSDNEDVHKAAACLSILLLVVPYTKASAGELIYCVTGIFTHRTLGVPRGGAAGAPRSFMRAFQRDGGKLKLGAAARRITVEEGRVAGVEASDGEFYPADVVVSNSGLARTVQLAGEENFNVEYVEKVNSLELSYSWIATKFALDRRVVSLRAPSLFAVPEMAPEEMFDYCDEPDGVPSDPFLFTPIPTEWDATVAPPGHQLIIMGVPTSNEVDQEERSQRILESGEKKLLSLFPEIERHLLWKSRITNKDTNAITRKGTGECIGLAQIPGQVGSNKPDVKLPIDGLWAVGCDAGARGVGTEQAVASAMLVSSLVDSSDGP